MAKGSRNTPRNGSEKKSSDKKSSDQIKAEIVARARQVVRRAVVRLNQMEMRTSGDPEGNGELIKSFKAFDTALENLTKPAQEDDENETEGGAEIA